MVRARKRFGQHFLEPAWVTKVIRAIDPVGSDVFVEIGPGRAALTRPLAALAGHVTAVEITLTQQQQRTQREYAACSMAGQSQVAGMSLLAAGRRPLGATGGAVD